MQQKYAEQGLQIITINLDTEESLVKAFLDKVPASIPIIYDLQGNIASDYQLIGMPSNYSIDKKGIIRFSHKGLFTHTAPLYEQELVYLLNE
ncbi:MAG: alkyl hydroperoxide reductase subunit AhpC [Paraglaciecola sp.]|jgi:alkyl hydroperoxide reductase subunit AhpC